jgi:hypothetical protein
MTSYPVFAVRECRLDVRHIGSFYIYDFLEYSYNVLVL